MNGKLKTPSSRWESAMRRIVFAIAGFLLMTSAASPAESLAWTRAHELYQRTDYAGSLRELLGAGERDAAVELLMGQDYYGLAEYKQATDSLEKAAGARSQQCRVLPVARPGLRQACGDVKPVFGAGVCIEGQADVREGRGA